MADSPAWVAPSAATACPPHIREASPTDADRPSKGEHPKAPRPEEIERLGSGEGKRDLPGESLGVKAA